MNSCAFDFMFVEDITLSSLCAAALELTAAPLRQAGSLVLFTANLFIYDLFYSQVKFSNALGGINYY